MIKKITLLVLLTISANIFSQKKVKGNGVVTIEKKDLNDFKKIVLNDDFKVILVKSNIASIEIETDENIHEYIDYKVYDSTFVLQTDNKLKPKKGINVTLFCTKNLNEIVLHGDSQVESLNTINLSEMFLKINNYAKADLSVKADKFKLVNNNKSKIQLRSKTKLNIDSSIADLSTAGSSDTHVIIKSDSLNINLKEKSTLEIEGNATNLHTTTKNSSNFKGKNLNVKNTFIATSDSSELSIQTFETITIEASGKSKVELYGNPKIELKQFTNSAKLHKEELNNK